MTRVLLLDSLQGLSASAAHDGASCVTSSAAPTTRVKINPVFIPNTDSELTCRLINVDDLKAMASDKSLKITQKFIDDFQRFGFTGVAATIDRQITGLLFLVSNIAAARHNSGGKAFRGIGLNLPEGVFYLFKVFVKPQFRGNRSMALMLRYASEQLKPAGINSIVTTTHWRNTSFLRSARRIGFARRGFATEIVLASSHYYWLPKPFCPGSNTRCSDKNLHSFIRFVRPCPEYP